MGVSKKGKRIIKYQDKEYVWRVYVWWVKQEVEYCDETWLTIVSMDKSLVLSYRVGECDAFVVSKGRVFQGRETSGKWESYWYPFGKRTPPMVITPGFVRELIAWAVDGRGAERVTVKKSNQGLLYRLVLSDDELSYENYKAEFDIGIFASRDSAERVGEHYLKHVQGFKDYRCSYRIVEKKWFGGRQEGSDVYMVYGWNENEEGDEVEIVESECFSEELAAKQEMVRMKETYARSEWSFCRYRIGEWNWKEGFVRV